MMTARGKWKVAGYLTAIFAAGMVSGWVVAQREAKTNPHPPHTPGPGFGRSFTNSSIYQVGLSPDQKAKVDEIFARYGKLWETRLAEQKNDMRKESGKRNEELAAALTPEQREQWEKLRKDREAARLSGTNSMRGAGPGDKGDRGPRNRGNRDKRGQDTTNVDTVRGVTGNPPTQSTSSPPLSPPPP